LGREYTKYKIIIQKGRSGSFEIFSLPHMLFKYGTDIKQEKNFKTEANYSLGMRSI